jgi:hypothetical protein
VGELFGICRKCGKHVFGNGECPAPSEEPWTVFQWHDNWETHGRPAKRPLTEEEFTEMLAFNEAPMVLMPGKPIGMIPNWGGPGK